VSRQPKEVVRAVEAGVAQQPGEGHNEGRAEHDCRHRGEASPRSGHRPPAEGCQIPEESHGCQGKGHIALHLGQEGQPQQGTDPQSTPRGPVSLAHRDEAPGDSDQQQVSQGIVVDGGGHGHVHGDHGREGGCAQGEHGLTWIQGHDKLRGSEQHQRSQKHRKAPKNDQIRQAHRCGYAV